MTTRTEMSAAFKLTAATLAVLMLSLIAMQSANAALVANGEDIISAPASVYDDAAQGGAENTHQQAFDEQQGVTIEEDFDCSWGALTEGDVVDSHMIFYNTAGGRTTTDRATWEFDSDVLCVMSDSNGAQEAATNELLGHPDTDYPGSFTTRGLEGGDSYEVNGNEIDVTMRVSEPGDWIRVVTRYVEPADTTPPVVACEEGVNPAGKMPKAKGTNEDGFFWLTGSDDRDESVTLILTDSETEEVIGEVAAGITIKLVEANGATPTVREMNGVVDYMIKTNGDLLVTAIDEAGNEAEATSCLVPNKPK